MGGFVDPGSPAEVEQVLAGCLPALGLPGTLEQLGRIAGLGLRAGRPGGLFRAAEPVLVVVGDRALRVGADGSALLDHVVGGIVLSSDRLVPSALPGVLAALVTRAVAASGDRDGAAVVLTSLRDAVSA